MELFYQMCKKWTPAYLRNLARSIENSGCKNYADYQKNGRSSGWKNERVKQHRKRSRFKVQIADKLNRAVYTWQRNDSHSARKDRALDNIRIERL